MAHISKFVLLFIVSISLTQFLGCSSVGLSGGGSDFELRKHQEVVLENGMRILYVFDNNLPYVSYRMLVGSGSASDPATQAGLASLTSNLLSKGTKDMSAIDISEAFGQYGSEFGSYVSEDYTLLTTSGLSFHGEELFKLFSEVVLKPAFSKKELNTLKNRRIAQTVKRIDSPGSFANLAWQDYLFDQHQYARPSSGTKKSLRSIRKKDITKFYLRNFRPNNTIVSIVGKIEPQLKEKIEKTFSAWKGYPGKKVQFGDIPKIEGRKIRFVHKPGLVQAQIRLGTKGIRRTNKDYLTLRVANVILGGAFSSRLVRRIRRDLGLTYSISSSIDARMDYGPFQVATFTKSKTVGKTVEEILTLLEKFHSEGVAKEEVESAKAYIKGIFPRTIETAERLAFNLMILRHYGIDDSYLEDFISNINSINVDDVNRVIKSYMNPKDLKILVYGDKNQSLKQVKAIGDVELKNAKDLL